LLTLIEFEALALTKRRYKGIAFVEASFWLFKVLLTFFLGIRRVENEPKTFL